MTQAGILEASRPAAGSDGGVRDCLEHVCSGMVWVGAHWCAHMRGLVMPWLTFGSQKGGKMRGVQGVYISHALLQCPSEDRLEGKTKSKVGLGWGCGMEGGWITLSGMEWVECPGLALVTC